MSDLLTQLGGLLLSAIPTAVLMAVVWIEYRLLVHGKLLSILAERRARTEGAMEKAREDISAAEARSGECEQRIREARLAICKAQDLRRKQQLEAHAAVVAEAQKAAKERVQSAHDALNTDVAQAKVTLHAEVDSIANQIVRTILQTAPATAATAGRD